MQKVLTWIICFYWEILLWVWSRHPSCAGWVWLPPDFFPGCSRPSGTQTHWGPTSLHTITTHTQASFNTMMHKKHQNVLLLSDTYMSILGSIKEIQRIPTQAGPQSPGCLPHTQTCNIKEYTVQCSHNQSTIYICAMDSCHFITPTSPSPKRWTGSVPQLLSICGHGPLQYPAPEPGSYYVSILH